MLSVKAPGACLEISLSLPRSPFPLSISGNNNPFLQKVYFPGRIVLIMSKQVVRHGQKGTVVHVPAYDRVVPAKYEKDGKKKK